MSWTAIFDGVGLLMLLAGALLCLAASIGLLTFPDLLSRMHAATKPQVLGVLLVLLGLALRLRDPLSIGMIILISLFQLLTIPVGSHMVGRAAYRTGQTEPLEIDASKRDDETG